MRAIRKWPHFLATLYVECSDTYVVDDEMTVIGVLGVVRTVAARTTNVADARTYQYRPSDVELRCQRSLPRRSRFTANDRVPPAVARHR